MRPVLTAAGGAAWEADLVAALAQGDLGVAVLRRCVDLADLLATAAAGQAVAALVDCGLRRLDRDALARLAAAGVTVVGLVPSGDEGAERRLRQLGIADVLASDTPPQVLCAAVLAAVRPAADGASRAPADPRGALPNGPPADEPWLSGEAEPGRIVAVWGPTGAPGRTTVAVGLASELAALGRPTLLVDADVYGGVVSQVLGMLDESAGIAAACRLANSGSLDAPALASLAQQLNPTLRVLSGIARPDRWPELRPAALEVVLALARGLAAYTVIDCGFALEQDEELAYDTLAPRRNGATLTALEQADTVIAVGSGDPVGLQRLVRGIAELKATLGVAPLVVVNRLRGSAVPGNSAAEVRAALARYAGVTQVAFVPQDSQAVDGAMATGRTLVEHAPGSPARLALRALAGTVADVRLPAARRRLGRARRSG